MHRFRFFIVTLRFSSFSVMLREKEAIAATTSNAYNTRPLGGNTKEKWPANIGIRIRDSRFACPNASYFTTAYPIYVYPFMFVI